MVERDLPKVDVEGSKPFSRSKIEEALSGLFYFIFGMGFEPEKRVRQNPVMHEVRKTDFELDTSTASASPKGLIATLRQQGILRLNNPFSRSKKQKGPGQRPGLLFLAGRVSKNPRRGFN